MGERIGGNVHVFRIVFGICVLVAMSVPMVAGPFVVFPKAGALMSPDGRFVVRETAREASASEFVGTFHSLWLSDRANGRSRKLCDYVGVAAVAWSGDFVLATQYLSKKTSRALIFSASDPENIHMIDQPRLIQVVPVELRDTLRENDHVFVEASSLEKQTLHLRVWGYGRHDANGFRWGCEYGLRDGAISCKGE